MVETVFLPPPRKKNQRMKWSVKGPVTLPSPFDHDYRWQEVSFDLEFELRKCPGSPVTLRVMSENQLVVFQLPRPVKVGLIRKKITRYSTDMVIEQGFSKPSTKFSFRCYYRRNWAYEEGVDRAILNYTFRVGV